MFKPKNYILAFIVFCTLPVIMVFAEGVDAGTHGNGMELLVLQLSIIIIAARIGGSFFERFHLPPVLGEIVAGIIIGPFFLGHLPIPGFSLGLFPVHPSVAIASGIPISPELYALTTIASLVLLFLVGLETDIESFLRFSITGSIVGIGGVIASFILGNIATVLCSKYFLGITCGFGDPVPLFMGVVTTATSVGITARILSENRKIDSPEGVTILSGAVVDDVMGIILLAVIIGVINGMKSGSIAWKHIIGISFKAVFIWLFFTISGIVFSQKISRFLKMFKDAGTISVISFACALFLAGIFEKSGLAMVIGAYTMGLSLSKTDISYVIQDKLSVLHKFFVPVFFCVMGMMLNFLELASWNIIAFGVVFVVFAVAGKLIGCSIPALFLNFNLRGALRIGMGMTPRGEITLIITSIGLSMGFLNHEYFGIVIIMTFLTTLITPYIFSKMLQSKKPVLRKEKVVKTEHTEIIYNMPNPETSELILTKVIAAFENEGFYVHQLSMRRRLYQIRKDQTFVTMKTKPEKLIFDCLERDAAFIHTLFYEVLAELERTLKQLKNLTDREKIGKKIFAEQKGSSSATSIFSQILHPSAVTIDLKGETKREIIEELLSLLVDSGRLELDKRKIAQKDILERESVMSTGMQDGIALPHARTDAVTSMHCVVGLKKEGIDFDSLDKKPSKIFIMTLSSKKTSEPQLQFMAEMSKYLKDKNIRSKMLSSFSDAELFKVFTSQV